MAFAKVRIRFRKAGDLRFVSHHDLMRCFERMLRRAALPYHATQGFNPKPRLIFALSLPLGIIGCAEVADLELDEDLPAEEIHNRLNRQTPAGLEIVSVERVTPKARLQVHSVDYRVALPVADACQPHGWPPVGLDERLSSLLNSTEHWLERTRPHKRRINLRPYVLELRLLPDAVAMTLLVTPTGTVRPDEVLRVLGLEAVLDAGTTIKRSAVTLQQEEAPVEQNLEQTEEELPEAELAAERRATPLIPGPMSYES